MITWLSIGRKKKENNKKLHEIKIMPFPILCNNLNYWNEPDLWNCKFTILIDFKLILFIHFHPEIIHLMKDNIWWRCLPWVNKEPRKLEMINGLYWNLLDQLNIYYESLILVIWKIKIRVDNQSQGTINNP